MKNKVGIGIIGTGFARKVQIPAFLSCENAEIVSVASGNLENARATAEEFGIGHFTADWRETVAREDVDLVCITTPPNLHREMTLFSLELGKHVLCEKPMAMNAAEAEEMTAMAKSKGVLALIDHELRFQPGRQKAYAMLRDGEIGKIRHAKYHFRAPHRGDPGLPWNWWSDIEQGGGALGAVNSHIIDSFNWFLGTEISSVFCQLQSHVKKRPLPGGDFRDVTTDDEANMILRFADGDLTEDATGLVSVSMTEQPNYKNYIEFFGTEGAIKVKHRGDAYVARSGENDWREIGTELGIPLLGVADTGFSRGFMDFAPNIVEAIIEGRTEIEFAATFEDGLKVQKVLDAARESNARGRIVELR
ncbi:MAG: Gfo/Idh/MocA family oxidoreductase [Saprospiraceae bacterium]|nr:Gfo/Idh/MocA family oxidoreductase [Pyrinomonadaceae bacterium]